MADELENLTGVVEGITYRNEANGYAVIEVKTGDEFVTVVVLPNRKADADGQGRGQDVLAVVAEKGGKHQYRQGLEEFLRHRRDGKVMRFEKSI